ncbi:MAG: hypothetical protein KDC34_09355 [Saprospiraceae bacterium]|nr:hypothetical protein [Saprospiraceae bacterium]
MDLKAAAVQARKIFLDEGFTESYEFLNGNSTLLSSNLIDELDAYYLRFREIGKQDRSGHLTSDQVSAKKAKLDADLLSFFRSLEADPAKKTVANTGLSPTDREEIERFITQARLESAFRKLESLKSVFPAERQTEITMLISEWETFRRERNMRMLDYQTQTMRTNQITYQLLELIS